MPFIVYYSSAEWCTACTRFADQLEKFAKAGTASSVKIAKIDISKAPATTARLLVFKIPTLFQYHFHCLFFV